LGHPCKSQRVSRLGSLTARDSSSGRQPNFAALKRGRHLYSAGRPSRWALAHILVVFSYFSLFWATVCKTVRHMLSDRCPICLSCPVVSCPKGAQPPNFRPMSVVAKRQDGSRCHLVLKYRPRHRRHCVRWGPSFPTERGTADPTFRPTLLWHGCQSQQLLSNCSAIVPLAEY